MLTSLANARQGVWTSTPPAGAGMARMLENLLVLAAPVPAPSAVPRPWASGRTYLGTSVCSVRAHTPMSNCELLPHPRLHPAFTQRPSFPTGMPFQSHVRRTALSLAQIRNPPSLPRHPCLQSCQERARRPQDPTPGRSEGGDGNAAGLVGLWNPAAGACPAGPASGTLRYHRFFKLWQNMQFTLFAITSRRH